MGIPDHLTCLLRHLYAGQEAIVRTGHGTTDWLQIGKGVRQGCILSPCLFNLYAEYIMRNAGLDKAQVDVFLEFSCFFNDPMDVGNLISGSSAFSKSSLNIWKFTVHILLKPSLEHFEHYFSSMWDECNYVVIWKFFVIAFLWDWNKNWPFPVRWPLLSFPNLLAYLKQHFNSIIF